MRKLLILALAASCAAHADYRCKDERGITHIGDTPPAACANVPMQEITKSGVVLRTLPPSLTPEQAKAKAEADARAQAQAKAADEQRRKDLALLSTYSSPKDFDVSLERNLEALNSRIKNAKERTAAIEKRQKELEEEMEFYKTGKSKSGATKSAAEKKKETTAQLGAEIERLKTEKEHLADTVVKAEKDKEQIRARSDADRARWQELKRLQADGKLDLRDPKEVAAKKK